MSAQLEVRALNALFRNHPETTRDERYSPRAKRLARQRRDVLLAWAASQTDEQLLYCRNLGAGTLRWIRENEPAAGVRVGDAGLREDLLLLLAECLVPMAFAVAPDAGRRQARLDALRAALAAEEKP